MVNAEAVRSPIHGFKPSFSLTRVTMSWWNIDFSTNAAVFVHFPLQTVLFLSVVVTVDSPSFFKVISANYSQNAGASTLPADCCVLARFGVGHPVQSTRLIIDWTSEWNGPIFNPVLQIDKKKLGHIPLEHIQTLLWIINSSLLLLKSELAWHPRCTELSQ